MTGHTVPRTGLALAVVALLAPFVGVAVAIVRWSDLPARVPTHFGFDGTPDGWTDKGPGLWFMVLMPLLVALVMIGIGALTLRAPMRGDADAVREVRAGTFTGLAGMAALLSIAITAINVVILTGASRTGLRWGLVGVLLATVVGVVWLLVCVSRVRHAAPTDSADEASYKWGMFYSDPDNPALFVPKRYGIGSTINVGHPAGKLVMVGLLVVPVVLVALALMTS